MGVDCEISPHKIPPPQSENGICNYRLQRSIFTFLRGKGEDLVFISTSFFTVAALLLSTLIRDTRSPTLDSNSTNFSQISLQERASEREREIVKIRAMRVCPGSRLLFLRTCTCVIQNTIQRGITNLALSEGTEETAFSNSTRVLLSSACNVQQHYI